MLPMAGNVLLFLSIHRIQFLLFFIFVLKKSTEASSISLPENCGSFSLFNKISFLLSRRLLLLLLLFFPVYLFDFLPSSFHVELSDSGVLFLLGKIPLTVVRMSRGFYFSF